MKLCSLILALVLTFNVIGSKVFANTCADLFESQVLKNIEMSKPVSKNAGEVLLDIFEKILNAPNNSTVKIYTKTIRNDGIGALLLLVSVYESRRERGLKFEFNLEDDSVSRIHSLFAERSTNKVNLSDASTLEKFSGDSVVVVQNKNYASVYRFNGDLTSVSLKNSAKKRPIPVGYEGRNMLRASPFHNVEGVQYVLFKDLDQASLDFISKIGGSYNLNHRSKIKMEENDIVMISEKAYDLALQLYVQKKGSAPKESMNMLQILKAAL